MSSRKGNKKRSNEQTGNDADGSNQPRQRGGNIHGVPAQMTRSLAPSHGVPGTLVTVLQPRDILLGRGAPKAYFEGSVWFRDVIAARKMEYMGTGRHHRKRAIAEELFEEIRKLGGRFLIEREDIDPSTAAALLAANAAAAVASVLSSVAADCQTPSSLEGKIWQVADDAVALEKIKQTLREKHSLENNPGRELSLLEAHKRTEAATREHMPDDEGEAAANLLTVSIATESTESAVATTVTKHAMEEPRVSSRSKRARGKKKKALPVAEGVAKVPDSTDSVIDETGEDEKKTPAVNLSMAHHDSALASINEQRRIVLAAATTLDSHENQIVATISPSATATAVGGAVAQNATGQPLFVLPSSALSPDPNDRARLMSAMALELMRQQQQQQAIRDQQQQQQLNLLQRQRIVQLEMQLLQQQQRQQQQQATLTQALSTLNAGAASASSSLLAGLPSALTAPSPFFMNSMAQPSLLGAMPLLPLEYATNIAPSVVPWPGMPIHNTGLASLGLGLNASMLLGGTGVSAALSAVPASVVVPPVAPPPPLGQPPGEPPQLPQPPPG